jgi:sugar phosphate isomerase/epimerase
MQLGYNTNGLAHHDLIQAIELLGEIGYRSVAITLDHCALNPFRDYRAQLNQVRAALDRFQMRSVIETGARFLLDPRTKHEPTLMTAESEGRKVRVDFLRRAIDVAAELSSDCVSCWSGILREQLSVDAASARLVDGLRQVLDHAEKRQVAIGFEPEPGMFIATMSDFQKLQSRLDAPLLKMTLDVGHLHCQDELPIAEHVLRWREWLVNVHIEDMRRGRHEHLMFGEGEMQFAPIIDALKQAEYQGGLHVELSRHSHEGSDAARKAFKFLEPLIRTG